MKKNESGRSLVEMLGVLAIMGVLSIGVVIGLKYGFNKRNANCIYKDITLNYMDLHSSSSVSDTWSACKYKSECNYSFFVQRDKSNNNFVMVSDVEQEVCKLLLDLADAEQVMVLYDSNNYPLTCQNDKQDIIASFSGVAPVRSCDKNGYDDCPKTYNSYCDFSTGVCRSCTLGQRANESGDGCIDLCSDRTDGNTISCVSQEHGLNWCCPSTGVCSDTLGECISDDNACIYELKINDFTADCSAKLSVSGYKADCSGSLTIVTNADGTQTASMSSSDCKAGEYCVFAWSKQSWGLNETTPALEASETVNFYGQCHSLLSSSAATPSAVATVNVSGCKEGEYCVLAWSEPTWDTNSTAPNLSAEYEGTMYGQCHSLLSSSGATVAPIAALSEQKGCNEDEYCVIQWSDSRCQSALEAAHTGRFYGACAPWNGTNTTCPLSNKGIIIE